MANGRVDVSDQEGAPEKSPVPIWSWRSSVYIFVAVLAIGMGLAVALASGWRSPTPQRAPDWNGADLVWQKHGDGTATVSPDGYQMGLNGPDRRVWATSHRSVADFELELSVRSLVTCEDASHGLLYRYQDAANYYLFTIGGDGYFAIAVVRAGELIPLQPWQQWPHVRRGVATNRLRVHCQGAYCRFYINDEFTAEITDTAFLEGRIGLWAQTFSDEDLEVRFSGLRLWLLD